MSGQMSVYYEIPKNYKWGQRGRGAKYPIIMIHGSQQTGANFIGTPDGRPGWAQYFFEHGWPVFVVDQPGHGGSGYFPNIYGPQAANPSVATVIKMFTAPELASPSLWPQAKLHTQWPGGFGAGVPGQYAFDQFFASQVSNMPNSDQALALTTSAVSALIKDVGPSILITHSMAGPLSWSIPQANPGKIKAIIAIEPMGNSSLKGDTEPGSRCGLSNVCLNFSPAVSNPGDLRLVKVRSPAADMKSCWLQGGPIIHKLNGLNHVPILIATGEASYHASYDYCTSKFLRQSGVGNLYVPLASVGIHGNGHMEMLEMNNLKIAAFYERWLTINLHEKVSVRAGSKPGVLVIPGAHLER
ncbi:alpha/beta hydrolase [Caballeronia sordidicola]|uniref:alpha/beta hydrolase n=1 Tax=Caballeronia sordidicola TaxID=196367 RepID=UPI00117D7010|nr:alpha/beta hydrolase [Caballeronia sordidicola]